MVRCEAVRWVDDEPLPGIVEVVLTDADGRAWSFVEKAPIFDVAGVLRSDADYPVSLLACNVLERGTDGAGRDTAVIDLLPWSITDQLFEVLVDRIEIEER